MVAVAFMCAATIAMAQVNSTVSSPDGSTEVQIVTKDGKAYYQVNHNSKPFVGTSRFGLVTNAFDFSELEYVGVEEKALQYVSSTVETSLKSLM